MIDPQLLADMYSTTYGVIKRQTAGMTHEESLMQLPFGGNCMNWVLGHIVSSRTRTEALLGLPATLSAEDIVRYKRGSEPVLGDHDANPIDRMLEDLDRSQQRLLEALGRTQAADLEQVKGDGTLAEALVFLHFHESYHTGQLEIFRQMVGRDAIIK